MNLDELATMFDAFATLDLRDESIDPHREYTAFLTMCQTQVPALIARVRRLEEDIDGHRRCVFNAKVGASCQDPNLIRGLCPNWELCLAYEDRDRGTTIEMVTGEGGITDPIQDCDRCTAESMHVTDRGCELILCPDCAMKCYEIGPRESGYAESTCESCYAWAIVDSLEYQPIKEAP